jgi:hypothetical protein
MYEIRIEGRPIDLFADQSVEFSRKSGLFNPNLIEGNGTLPFDVKVTEHNKRLLGYPHLQQIGWRKRSFYAEKHAFGSVIERGFIEVQTANDQKIQCYFTQNLSEIFGQHQNTTLNQLALGSEAMPVSFLASANHLTDKYALPQVQNPVFYGNNSVGGFNGIVNEHNGSAYVGSTKVPMLFNRFLLEKLSQITSLSFLGDFVNDPDYQHLLIHNTHSLDNATTISYANHLPELTIGQYFVELKRLFNLVMKFDVHARTLKMDSVASVFSKPCRLDWSNKVAPIKGKNPENSQALELEFGLNSSDARTKTANPDYDKYRTAILPGQKTNYQTIKTAWSSLTTDAATGLPVFEGPGISPNHNQQINKFTPQFLFWNGIVGGKPTASNNEGNTRLAYFGPNNLYEKCWANYEKWKSQTFATSAEAYLSAADVVTFDHSEKVHINGVNYYVDELKLQLKNESSSTVRATLNLYKA